MATHTNGSSFKPKSPATKRPFNNNHNRDNDSASPQKKYKPNGNNSFSKPSGGFQARSDRPPTNGTHQKRPYTGKPGDKHSKFSAKKPVALTRDDRKQLRKERRASKPHAEIVASANSIWTVQINKLEPKLREQKIDEVIVALSTKQTQRVLPSGETKPATGTSGDKPQTVMMNVDIVTLSNKHDVSRVVQLAIKYGTTQQRTQLMQLFKGKVYDLSRGKYSHYIILKLLQYTHKDIRQQLRTELLQSKAFIKFSLQSHSAKVLDYLYAISKNQVERNEIMLQFYSQEAVMHYRVEQLTDIPDLKTLLATQPQRQMTIYNNLKTYLQKALDKEMAIFRFIQALLYHTLLSYPEVLRESEMLESLRKASGVLWHTQQGAHILQWLIQISNAKDRKTIVKLFKGKVLDIAINTSGYGTLVSSCAMIDDTVLVQKQILSEIIPTHVVTLATHATGVKLLLWLLSPNNPAYCNASDLEQWSSTTIIRSNAEDATPEACYKKQIPVKQTELLQQTLLPMAKMIAFEETLLQLVATSVGCSLVYEICREAQWRALNDKLYEKQANELLAAVDTALELIASASVSGDNEGTAKKATDELFVVGQHTHRLLKRLLFQLPQRSEFAQILYNCIAPDVPRIALNNRGAFVTCSLLHAAESNKTLHSKLLKQLKPQLPAIEKSGAQGHTPTHSKKTDKTFPSAGCQLLAKILRGEKVEASSFDKEYVHPSLTVQKPTHAAADVAKAQIAEDAEVDETAEAEVTTSTEYGAQHKVDFNASDDEEEMEDLSDDADDVVSGDDE